MSQMAIKKLALFEGLNQEDVDLLVDLFVRETFGSEEIIFPQGGLADRLFILVSGEVAIRFKPHDGEELVVTVISPGEVFGWSAALGRESYTSCACATTTSEAISIRGSDLRRLCQEHPQTGVVILERLAGVIAQRLRNTHEHVIEMLRNGMNP